MLNKKLLTAAVLAALGTSMNAAGAAPAEAEMDSYMLDDTVVTAERVPSKRMETPANIAVITAQEIADNHYNDVAEALDHVNGVTVTRQGSGEEDIVRLNGDDRVVVLVDGQRLNNDQGVGIGRAGTDLKMLPSVKNIARIEVIKGGASALYGSDAVGGVVNIITKKGIKNETTLDLNTGSWGTHNYELTNQGTAGKVSWFLTGSLNKRSYFKYKADGETNRMPSSDYGDNGLSLRMDVQLEANTSLGLTVMHRAIDRSAYYWSTNRFVPSSPQNSLFNNVAVTYRFKEDTNTPGVLRYFNNYKTTDFSGKFDTRLQGVDYQDGWQSRNHTVVAGAEYHESKSSNAANHYKNERITTKSLYVQDTVKLTDKWNTVLGARMDNHSAYGTHWTPKIAVNYLADKKTQAYASWGRVFKAPQADDLYYYADWGTMGYFGNPNLKPETGHTESVGVNHNFNDNTAVSVSYFRTELSNAINWASSDGSYWYAENVNRERKQGIELSFQQKLSPQWSYDLGYSWLDSEATVSDPTSNATKLLNNQNPPRGYKLGIHYAQGAWKANLLGRMGSGLNQNVYADSRYALFDLNVSYDVTDRFTTYFKIQNLTNQAWSAYVSKAYPGAGRFFQIGATYRF